MIQLDNDFQTVQPQQAGVYQKPPAGGYVFKVLKSEEGISRNGSPIARIELDIADGEFAGAFEKYPAKYSQNCTGASTPYFKGMLTAFKVSNPNYNMASVVQNNQFNASALTGLLIGGNLREEEYMNDMGELKTAMKIQYLCDVDLVRQGKIKPLGIKKVEPAQHSQSMVGTGQISNMPPAPKEDFSDDLPF